MQFGKAVIDQGINIAVGNRPDTAALAAIAAVRPAERTEFFATEWAQPFPPSPAITSIFASSMNFMFYRQKN